MKIPSEPITTTLAALCLVLSLAVGIDPNLRQVIGNAAAHSGVRMITSPFVHGFSRTSMLPHLFGNLILLLIVGRHLEQRVGSYRFLLVTICALLAYGFIQILANYDVNGASVFIWAYAPPCAVAAWGKRQHAESRTIGVLVVMWVLIPLAMTAVPFAYGFQGNILNAFLIANTFHISASLVGTVFAILWRKDLEKP